MKFLPVEQHNSPETAYVIEDYPYGRTLRCKKRVWIEYKKNQGYRIVSQTTNPKITSQEVWNKPKASIYTSMAILYIDESNGYLEHFSMFLSGLDRAEAALEFLGKDGFKALDKRQQEMLLYALARCRVVEQMKKQCSVSYESDLKALPTWENEIKPQLQTGFENEFKNLKESLTGA